MTRETETYPDRRAFDNAKKRTATRHTNGWRKMSESTNTLTITWDNTPDPPTPRRQMTRAQFEDEQADRQDIDLI